MILPVFQKDALWTAVGSVGYIVLGIFTFVNQKSKVRTQKYCTILMYLCKETVYDNHTIAAGSFR